MTKVGIRYLVIVLAGLLAALLIFLFFQYDALRQEQIFTARQLRAALFLQHHAPLPVSDADSIRSWMTFDYIDKLFALPQDYLKVQLHIIDPRYPRLTITSYTKEQSLATSTVLGEIENAVRAYTSSTSGMSPQVSSTSSTSV